MQFWLAKTPFWLAGMQFWLAGTPFWLAGMHFWLPRTPKGPPGLRQYGRGKVIGLFLAPPNSTSVLSLLVLSIPLYHDWY